MHATKKNKIVIFSLTLYRWCIKFLAQFFGATEFFDLADCFWTPQVHQVPELLQGQPKLHLLFRLHDHRTKDGRQSAQLHSCNQTILTGWVKCKYGKGREERRYIKGVPHKRKLDVKNTANNFSWKIRMESKRQAILIEVPHSLCQSVSVCILEIGKSLIAHRPNECVLFWCK